MHQVFVSHATEDEGAASRVCEMLEADGIGCWLACRDATTKKDRSAESLEAIRTSDLVLVVFSAAANASQNVLHELEKAVACKRPVLPLRVDDATPSVALERYFDLASRPDAIISSEAEKKPESAEDTRAAKRWRPRPRTIAIAAALAVLVAAVGLGLGLGLDRHHAGWVELSPSGTIPPARNAHAMTYDPITQRMIVFGGTSSILVFNRLWAFDPVGDSWVKLETRDVPPSARVYSSLVFEPTTQRLIAFGGLDEFAPAYSDATMAYDPTAGIWTSLRPGVAVPSARARHTLVYDPGTGTTILFGGLVGGDPPDTVFGDTWAYDPVANTWTELKPAGSLPSPRGGHAMAYDPVGKRMILFGGGTASARFNDTWAYDPVANTWTELKPAGTLPSPRSGHAMAYDPISKRMILFGGGATEKSLLDDTWAYDPAANTWTELELSGAVPPARGSTCLVYDPNTQRLIMFGGAGPSGSDYADTWAFTP